MKRLPRREATTAPRIVPKLRTVMPKGEIRGRVNAAPLLPARSFVALPAVDGHGEGVRGARQYSLHRGQFGALTAIPAPQPTPTPPPAVAAPTVKVSGPKSVKTTKAKLALKGTATGLVTSVVVQVGSKGGAKPAKGTANWK